MRSIAAQSNDPLARETENVLKEFGNSDVVGFEYCWKYLPDDAFIQNYCGNDLFKMNHAFLSHLARVAEAFQVSSVWRCRDLVTSCVDSLNNNHLVSAGALARALIELAVHYGYAANTLRASFERFEWQTIRTHAWQLEQKDEKGKKIGLESSIERLMAGTRLKQRLAQNPDLEQKTILSYIDKIDKALVKKGAGYSVRAHYEFLCEPAHPNAIGYERFFDSERELNSGWTERLLRERADSFMANKIAEECLWALSFSAGSMGGLFHEFQELTKNLAANVGRILPY